MNLTQTENSVETDGPVVDLDLTVVAREVVAESVVALTLVRPDGERLPAWTPGAHVDLVLGDNLIRQYSLCGDPGVRDSWTVAVLREDDGRGGSKLVHERLSPGQVVKVRGPRNHFPLEPARRYIFIAGGIGITPLMPMVARADRMGAEWSLAYGGKRPESMAFADGLQAAYGDKVSLRPQETCGPLDLAGLIGDVSALDPETLVYCCGPEGLLEAVESHCASDMSVLRTERFRAAETGDPSGDSAFEVELDATGDVFTVNPGESILDVLRRNGHGVEASCEEGTCGTCETGVVAGEVDHRDSVLTPSERQRGDLMMICVSRAACPRLVLEI